MAAAGRLVQLYYDVASPYSWFAFETLCRYRTIWNIELSLQPVILGGIFIARSKGKKPTLNPRKGAYSAIDTQRLSKYFDVPINQPKNLWEVLVTKGTLKSLRFITAVNMTHPHFTEELSRQLWRRIYVEDVDATEEASLREAALKSGMNEDIISDALTRMTDSRVKDKLRSVTKEALDLGAFGAPFIVAHVDGKKEIFFGSDRFHIMAMVLGETWQGPHPFQESRL